MSDSTKDQATTLPTMYEYVENRLDTRIKQIHDVTRDHACKHTFSDGTRCYAVARAGHRYCRWHTTIVDRKERRQSARSKRTRNAIKGLEIPFVEDALTLQESLHEVMDAIIDGRVDNRRAALLLYGLQIARSNVRGHLYDTRSDSESLWDLVADMREDLEDEYDELREKKSAERKPPTSDKHPACVITQP